MKKFLSVFLTVILAVGIMAVTVSAVKTGIFKEDVTNITCSNLLDFNKETNELWAQEKKDGSGNWECFLDYSDSFSQPADPDTWIPIAPVVRPLSSFSAHKWSMIEDGEALRFQSTDSSIYPGIAFSFDLARDGLVPVGKESGKKAEYVKIRLKNHSVCDQVTFGFITTNTNNGNFVSATVSELTEDANGNKYTSSDEDWQTYTFSMHEINMNTNYDELIYDPLTQEPFSRWGANLLELVIFPFGYDVQDGSGNYPGATMDIDYIVIGSRDYVDNYQSELEIKESMIEKIEIQKTPNKLTYYVGEPLDLEGLEIKATYKDGYIEGNEETLNTASADILTFDEVLDKVTLKFGRATATFDVTVIDITSIEVIATPEDTVFEVDEGFNSNGYQFRVNYADGSYKTSDFTPEGSELANTSFSFVADFATPGTKDVDVYYYGKSTNIVVDMIQIVGVEITTNKEYRYDIAPKIEDFTITLVYSDGSTKNVPSTAFTGDNGFFEEATLECDTKTFGLTKVKLVANDTTYGINLEAEVDVNIIKPVDIRVTTAPTKTEYLPDDKFDTTDMIVSLIYTKEDGTEEAVAMDPADYVAKVAINEPGEKTVAINSYNTNLNVLFEEFEPTTPITIVSDGADIEPSEILPFTIIEINDGWVLPVIIIAAIIVVGAIVVIVIVAKKKKNK